MNVNVVILVVSLVHNVVGQLDEGDSCIHEISGLTGTCTNILSCPDDLKTVKQGVKPQQCGFDGVYPIVCCLQPGPRGGETSTKSGTIPTSTREPSRKTVESSTESRKIPTSTRKPSRKTGEISREKCKEYSKYQWTTETSPILDMEEGDIVRLDCPFNRKELVVGGEDATEKEFPHMVHLGYVLEDNKTAWACGGSLISDQFVLTAAHCFDGIELQTVRMGITDQGNDTHIQLFDIIEWITHPEYLPQFRGYDIALVKVNRKAKLNTWVRPACLHSNSSSPDSNAIACGWGKLYFGGDTSQILQKVVLKLYGVEHCGKFHKKNKRLRAGINDRTMICAGSPLSRDTCQGDSGGPLQVYMANGTNMSCMYDIIGITSFGFACAIAPDVPSGYTRVSYFVKWIEDIVWPLTEN